MKTCMGRSLLKVVVGCAFFAVWGFAQSSSDPGATMVSPPAANIQPVAIEPGAPSPDEKVEESAIVADPASLIPDLPPVRARMPRSLAASSRNWTACATR